MKKLTTCILFLFMLTEFYSCEDSIPRGRPTIVDSNVSVTDNTDTTDTTDENEVTQRPSGAIIIQPDACACQNGEPISIGNCEAICASKQSTNEPNRTFFFDVELTESITLDDNYIDVAGWCSSLPGETANNSCSYEIKDENGATSSLPFDPGAGLQSFELDVGGLDTDQTYRITLVESTSQARSTTIQLRLFSDLIDDTIGGPMALMPVNSYSCLFRDGEFDTDTGQLIVNDVARFHFYFIPETRPEPLGPATVPTVNCYDIETYGDIPINSPLFEESTGAFTVWNKDDPRFFFLSWPWILF